MAKHVGKPNFKEHLHTNISRLEHSPAVTSSCSSKKTTIASAKPAQQSQKPPSLNYSDKEDRTAAQHAQQPPSAFAPSQVDLQPDSEAEDDDSDPLLVGSLSSWFKSVTGNAPLTAEALQPALQQMKTHLISKNVAHDAAALITESVQKQLIGTAPGAFSSVSRAVLTATRQTLQTLLTPDRPNDLLAECERKAGRRPFVITFVGVNGVGKSTSLSKIAFWLLQHGKKVLIAAGDTFRAGAVEQLRVHVRNLSVLAPGRVELFERGYGKDAAEIATEAINKASKNGFDVVLLDTAGRMQGNEPLMRSLAKLVAAAKPDRLLFVGEALVGHEALSQLSQFNSFLQAQARRKIDGLVVSKVDTIDDRIGAVVSMTVAAGAPVLFLGCGQTYTDLKRLSIKQVVNQLFQ